MFHRNMGAANVRCRENRVHTREANADRTDCYGCRRTFSLFYSRKQCSQCKRNYCRQCVYKVSRLGLLCSPCEILNTGILSRDDLLKYKARDLQLFLQAKAISSMGCTEKTDLVDLVMSHFNVPLDAPSDPIESISTHTGVPISTVVPECRPVTDPPNTDSQVPPYQEPYNESRETTMDSNSSSQNKETNKIMKLSEIKDELDINKMSIRQLKQILASNFVDYKEICHLNQNINYIIGCCEKNELIVRVNRLYKEHQKNVDLAIQIDENDKNMREDENRNDGKKVTVEPEKSENMSHSKVKKNIAEKLEANEVDLCKICLDAVIDCVLLDCGHMVTCTTCGRRLSECPICRQFIVRVVHTFKA